MKWLTILLLSTIFLMGAPKKARSKTVTFTWPAVSGATYDITTSTDLINWQLVYSTTNTTVNLQVQNEVARFFKVIATQSSDQVSVTLAWDPSPSPEAVGYFVYTGLSERVYFRKDDANNATTHTINSLTNAVTYHFAATAYDEAGEESDYSNEAVYTPLPFTHTLNVTIILNN